MKRLALVMLLLMMHAVSFAQTRKLFPIHNNFGYPDLVIDSGRILSSLDVVTRTFSSSACELEEHSIEAAGARRLLRFDLAVVNVGDGDLLVGDPVAGPYSSEFHLAPCHQHYHLDGFSDFKLLNLDGSVAALGHKQAFCMEDSVKYGAGASHGYTCENQGITSGWADVYTKYLSGQWIDITGLAAGDYVLRVEINATDTFYEGPAPSARNFEEVTIRIPALRGKK